MATETFLAWIVSRFAVVDAADAWLVIELAAGGRAPEAPAGDPVHMHKAK